MRAWPVLLVTVLGFLSAPMAARGEDRTALWARVADARASRLPVTACRLLESIIPSCVAEGAYAEAVKAVALKAVLEGEIQGGLPEEVISRLALAIPTTAPQAAPMLHGILAHWYLQYLHDNQYQILNRTPREAHAEGDLTSWDVPRIRAEIDHELALALSDRERIQAIPIGVFSDVLKPGNVPDAYRPTVFDFLCHDAITFYTSDEMIAARQPESMPLAAESSILAEAGEFLTWSVEAGDTTSTTFRAVRLFQDLLRFHANDQDRRAWFDADLERLAFGYRTAVGDPQDEFDRYRKALHRVRKASRDPEIAAKAVFLLASELKNQGDLLEARRWAAKAAQSAPGTIHGERCAELVRRIQGKDVAVETERIWNVEPELQVRYRNIERVYFRLIPVPRDRYLDPEFDSHTGGIRLEKQPTALTDSLLTLPATYEWQVDLPRTSDYQGRVAEVSPPKELKPGVYFLLSSHRPDFGREDNVVSVTNIWVTRLALVLRLEGQPAAVNGLVLDAVTGDPVAGAAARLRDSAPESLDVWKCTTSDADGLFFLPRDAAVSYLIHVQHLDQEVTDVVPADRKLFRIDGLPASRPSGGPQTRTFFFTDRAIYRPGQLLRYKGICTRSDPDAGAYAAAAGETLTVVLRDAANQEVARENQCCNEYGSFSGSFRLPDRCLAGSMRIETTGTAPGEARIQVEEYKRPTFEVTLDRPTETPGVGALVKMPGTVKSYTGAAINDATVRYTVRRTTGYRPGPGRIPPRWNFASGSLEIARGSTTTRSDGSFVVSFSSRPDPRVHKDDDPVYSYDVSVEVVDPAGETQSAQRRIRIGHATIHGGLRCRDWQTVDEPVDFQVRTYTLNGDPRAGTGEIVMHRLKQPGRAHRPRLLDDPAPRRRRTGTSLGVESALELSRPMTWPLADVVRRVPFTTDELGQTVVSVPLNAGEYRAVIRVRDGREMKATGFCPIRVLDPSSPRLSIPIPAILSSPNGTVEPGGVVSVLWGSGYRRARALVEVLDQGRILRRFWTPPGRTQVLVEQAVTEQMRGSVTVRVTMIRENRPFFEARRVEVPWNNKRLQIRWEHFTSDLRPSSKETWTALVVGPDSLPAETEMVAELYDASLDAFKSHTWPRLDVFRRGGYPEGPRFGNRAQSPRTALGRWNDIQPAHKARYRSFPEGLLISYRLGWGTGVYSAAETMGQAGDLRIRGGRAGEVRIQHGEGDLVFADQPVDGAASTPPTEDAAGGTEGRLDRIVARTNLDETALFLPHLRSGPDGVVKIEFVAPEALTRWRFLGLAHDRELRSGFLTGTAVTSRDLMVEPNPPRFLREGDSLVFVVKVTNRTEEAAAGTVRLTFTNAETGEPADSVLGNRAAVQDFEISPRETRVFAWPLAVAEDIRALNYRAVGATDRFSDGVEGRLPVLPRRVLVTETLPLPMRGPGDRTFAFTNLVRAAQSSDLRHQRLVVEMVSNPAWYAVMALPSLVESPHPCVEETFNSLYASLMARYIVQSDPRIQPVFDQWRGTPALESPLQKNADLKAVALEETPWVQQAGQETDARRNIGRLFDRYHLRAEVSRLESELRRMQLPDGAWPWIPEGTADDAVTLRIVTGLGRLRNMGVDLNVYAAARALDHLDVWCDRTYRAVLERGEAERGYLAPDIALYLYGRSFFLTDQPIPSFYREAVDYFVGQARRGWMDLPSRRSQAQLALACSRFGFPETATAIVRSLKERSVLDDELGRFWRDQERAGWPEEAPIETQAMMIEAFAEVAHDSCAVEECQAWLLKRKQTEAWGTSRATVDAIFALLLRGAMPLHTTPAVEVWVGPTRLTPGTAEAGTGYFERVFPAAEVSPALGTIRVRKRDAGMAWGSAYWQYLQSAAAISSAAGNPLQVRKELYTRREDGVRPTLVPLDGPVEVGSEIVVRLELRGDRDLEYVHLEDARGSGTEPLDVLSRFRWSDGLSYYKTTRDAATHFYVQRLPKGTHVLEYSTRAVHRGMFQSGSAEVQCLYAPEFSGHSEGAAIEVR